MNKLICLGTAKLDNHKYGYSDSDIDYNYSAEDILKYSYKNGIKAIDTSPRYNNAEKIIGDCLNRNNLNFFISSKIENLEVKSHYSCDKILSSVKDTLENLHIKKLNICFLHQNEVEIISDKYIMQGLNILKDHELVDEVGTSIYSENELDFTIESHFYDWIQIPVNILDNYFYNRIKKTKSNIKVAARSVLLQGMLFQDDKTISKNIRDSKKMIEFLEFIKKELNIDNKNFNQISIAYLKYLENLSMIIIGSRSLKHIEFFMNSLNQNIAEDKLKKIHNHSNQIKEWSNPRNW